MKTETKTTVNLDSLRLLGTKNWVKDYGLKKAVNANPGNTEFEYYEKEQSHRYLCDLLGYMDKTKNTIIKYYDLPQDTLQFLTWVFSEVNSDYFQNGKKPKFHNMPFKKLYTEVYKKILNGETAYKI